MCPTPRPATPTDLAFTTLADAAPHLGFPTADALRRAFTRQLIPARFLIRLGKRTVRVDLQSLLVFLRKQAAASEGGEA